jgi:hypothetical protein
MTPLILMVIVALGIMLILKSFKPAVRRNPTTATSPPVHRVASLLTDTELDFFRVLDNAAKGRCRIMCKVRLIDLIDVDKSNYAWFNKIVPRHVDFVLCHSDTFVPLCVVELDDPSHEQNARKEKDKELNLVLQAAGIDCARFRTTHNYSPTTIKARIEPHLAPVPASHAENPDAKYMPKVELA